jgi:hypothetical protein
MSKIYVASSWRNPHYPPVVEALRKDGHEVYDFKNPVPNTGFRWEQCAVGDVYDIPNYFKALKTERAKEGFASDKAALDWCDVLVLALPCGRSAHLEAGYAVGCGKKVYALLHEDKFEPDLMYLMCEAITTDLEVIRSHLKIQQ